MAKKLLFIINPISGNAGKLNLGKKIEAYFDKSEYQIEIAYTKGPGHAVELSKEAADKNYSAVIAAGGDGTMHECAIPLIGTATALGILPSGSGNGLSRHLLLPMHLHGAMATILAFKTIKIDTLEINNAPAIGIAGIGFDAHIAHQFAHFGKRGLKSYFQLIMREFKQFKNFSFQIDVDKQSLSTEAFMITLANSSQFGNNAYIAPRADCSDGYLEICIMQKPQIWDFPLFAWQLFNKQVQHSKLLKTIKTTEAKFSNITTSLLHLDGEPRIIENNQLSVKINPLSLNVIIP